MGKRAIYLFSLFLLFSCSNNQHESKLRLIHDAHIFSFEGEAEREFEAMVLDGDEILCAGSFDSLSALYPHARRISMEGRTIYPGFHDAHTHFYAFGKGLNEVDLRSCKSWEEVLNRVLEYSKNNPEKKWLVGRGWDQNLWKDKVFPDRSKLDSLFGNKYVFLKRIDGHAAIVNENVLSLSGINGSTEVEGGLIIKRVGSDIPSGVLVDNAVDLVQAHLESPTFKDIRANLLAAQEVCLNYGITAITEAGLDLNIIKVIDSLQRSGELKMRIVAMLNPGVDEFEFAENHGPIDNEYLKVSSFKLYADGALGSRGALLKSPYCDNSTSGLALHDAYYFHQTCQRIYDLNFQVCTHCIGDSANKLILDIYGSILKGENDRRWRIEHAQVLDPKDIELFHKFKVIPSVQPTHATSDGSWAENRLCEDRMKGAYAYSTLLDQAGLLALGTDFPVEEVTPMNTYLSAVFRRNRTDSIAFRPEEKLSSFHSLKGMTYWPAIAGFTDNYYGSLASGKKADFIVLDRPLSKLSYDELIKTNPVKEVWIAGNKLIEQ